MSLNSRFSSPIDLTQSICLSAYSPKLQVSLTFPADSPFTKQEFRDECDINILMSRYQSSGELPNLNEREPQFVDVSGYDYQESMQFVAGAQSLFNELPSSIRNRFSNDPGQFLDFCSNNANREEMASMGLLKPRAEWAIPNTPQDGISTPAASQVPSPPISDSPLAP